MSADEVWVDLGSPGDPPPPKPRLVTVHETLGDDDMYLYTTAAKRKGWRTVSEVVVLDNRTRQYVRQNTAAQRVIVIDDDDDDNTEIRKQERMLDELRTVLHRLEEDVAEHGRLLQGIQKHGRSQEITERLAELRDESDARRKHAKNLDRRILAFALRDAADELEWPDKIQWDVVRTETGERDQLRNAARYTVRVAFGPVDGVASFSIAKRNVPAPFDAIAFIAESPKALRDVLRTMVPQSLGKKFADELIITAPQLSNTFHGPVVRTTVFGKTLRKKGAEPSSDDLQNLPEDALRFYKPGTGGSKLLMGRTSLISERNEINVRGVAFADTDNGSMLMELLPLARNNVVSSDEGLFFQDDDLELVHEEKATRLYVVHYTSANHPQYRATFAILKHSAATRDPDLVGIYIYRE